MCFFCKHLSEDNRTCDAYPEGIPDKIYLSEVDHRLPWTNDDGVQFEAKSPADAKRVEERWNDAHPAPVAGHVQDWIDNWNK